MCVVSMIMDHYSDKWGGYVGKSASLPGVITVTPPPPPITADEIAEFRRLLERAREYDKRHNEPDCELEAKKTQIRDLCRLLGVEIQFL